MLTHEKRFRIISIAICVAIIGILLFALYAPTSAIEFDPDKNIIRELDLPNTNVDTLGVKIVQWALGFLGLVAVIMIIYGGFTWMLSAGNEQRVTQGKEVIKWAVIGLVVVMLAWAIVVFVVRGIETQALNTNPLSVIPSWVTKG